MPVQTPQWTFVQTLPSDLRRSVLEDMEDSVLAVMPPDIAAEAQALRREQEAWQRQLMHERLFGHSSTSALSAILRSPGMWSSKGRVGASGKKYRPDISLLPLTSFLFLEAFTSHLSGNRGVQYTHLAIQRGGTFQMSGSSSHTRCVPGPVSECLLASGHNYQQHSLSPTRLGLGQLTNLQLLTVAFSA